jgi:hypothetical protein
MWGRSRHAQDLKEWDFLVCGENISGSYKTKPELEGSFFGACRESIIESFLQSTAIGCCRTADPLITVRYNPQ